MKIERAAGVPQEERKKCGKCEFCLNADATHVAVMK